MKRIITKNWHVIMSMLVTCTAILSTCICFADTITVDGLTYHYYVGSRGAFIDHLENKTSLGKPLPACYGVTPAELLIPEIIDGHHVVGIGPLAFQMGSSTDTKIAIIPEHVAEFDSMSFVSIYNGWNNESSSYAGYTLYDHNWSLVSQSGLDTFLFSGDNPTKTYGSWSWDNYKYRVCNWIGTRYAGVGHTGLSSCKCYFAEGSDGWTAGEDFCGANMQIGAARVFFLKDGGCVTSGDTVELLCKNSSGIIFYTTNGSKPTCKESSVCKRYSTPIIVDRRMTIKALAYVQSYPYQIVYTREFALGNVAPPYSTTAKNFHASHTQVPLQTETEDAIIRYTLDGSVVTENSTIYTAPFSISETTTVRAKAFKKDWFDSEEVIQTFTRLWYTNETPLVSAAAETFDAVSQEVSLSCDTEDATIYYTIDGSEPSATNGRVYKRPFDIYQTTTVKAIAVKDDWKDSAVVAATFTKANEIGPAINLLEMLPDNDKTHPWTVVTDVTHDGVSAVKSGEISDDESTTMKVVVYGAGELSFWWRTSCEPTIGGELYDFASFYDGTTAVTNLAGVTDWQRVARSVEGTGKHTFKWTYQKDGSGSTVPDGVWVDQVQWLPKTDDWYSDHTLTTEAPVKYDWLRKYGLAIEDDFETAAKAATGKSDGTGRELTVEDDFVAGTDPTNELSHFEAMIEMTNGVPFVRWTPDLNEDGSKELRTYKIWGKETLDNSSDWEYPTNSLHHFFRVTVEMP